MSKYLIESPNTEEECLKALDQIIEKDPNMLDKYEFGCMSGDHTGYATVEASSEQEACQMVPTFLQDKAKVVELTKFTQEQVRSFHQS